MLKFKNEDTQKEAISFCQRALDDNTDLRREINNIFKHFSEYGDIIDLNLDFFPDKIIITFAKHQNILTLLSKGTITYLTLS